MKCLSQLYFLSLTLKDLAHTAFLESFPSSNGLGKLSLLCASLAPFNDINVITYARKSSIPSNPHMKTSASLGQKLYVTQPCEPRA